MRLRAVALAGLTVLGLSGCGAATQVNAPALQPAEPRQVVATSQSGPASPSAAASPAPSAGIQAQPPVTPPPAAPVAGPAVKPTPASYRLGPLVYMRQSLNNCGPAAIAEVLRYWGINRTQDQVQQVVRPDLNSRGMWPYGVPSYVDSVGMSSLMGVGGTPTIVRALVANGFPVIVAQWVSADDHTAHYREIEGFDDNRQVFVSTDTYLGPNHEISYAEYNVLWERGNQRFMVIYPPDKQPVLNAVLKSVDWDKTAAYQADLVKQQTQQIRPLDQQPFPGQQFKGMSWLGKAWDHIQLGQLDLAGSEIAQAQQEGASPLLLRFLNQALQTAS